MPATLFDDPQPAGDLPADIPPALLPTLDTAGFRAQLARLQDPHADLPPSIREHARLQAIAFISTLPQLFGDGLDRMTLWDRIASAIETAAARTAGTDYEMFIAQCLEHVRASAQAASRSLRLQRVLQYLGESNAEEHQAWISYMVTHRLVVIAHARSAWERYKEACRNRDTEQMAAWGELIEYTEPATGETQHV